MSSVIHCERPCNAVELRKIMEIDERLEGTGPDSDSRIPLDSCSIIVGEVFDSIAVSVCGTVYGQPLTSTVTGSSVGECCALLKDTMCTIFKVDEQPF